jgi:hypothetical protein
MVNDIFRAAIKRSHPVDNIGIDHVEDYGGSKVVFFRAENSRYIHHRVAVFVRVGPDWLKENDIIVSQQ